ncbi:MAG: glycosyl hydrolase family 28 protein [Clostridia bacterium]|nr:glycosyl hydrolase family 28 protein [Clostridia bacterium]
MNQSLIFAEGCENICICGGELDGQGTRANFPGDETCHGTPGRPFLMRIIDCRNVHVHDITLRSAACWMENYLNCDRVLLERVTVRNQTNYNNDGIDIDGCRDVIIRSCDVESGDDACCFKGASERNTERVLIENCRLYSCCNALKVGTDTQGDFRDVLVRNCQIGGVEYDPSGLKHRCSDSGVSLEMVDGGTLENFLIENITIDRAWSPFFLRLEDRGRVKPGDPKPPVGTLRRIAISHVRGGDNGARGSYFIGIPEKAIEDVLLHDVVIAQHASEKAVLDEGAISELRGVYPDAHMIDDLGDAPARGLWARHVHGLSLAGYDVIPDKKDARPYLVAETDVTLDKNACL